MVFTERPKSGKARKLWDWFTRQEFTYKWGRATKEAGSPPALLCVIRPGHWQRKAGAARYEIVWEHTSFYVHDPDETLARNAEAKQLDNFYYL
jgi:hypothetical protein